MAKFLVLYRSPMSPKEMMAQASPEEAKAGMDAWMAWAGRAGEAVVDLGAPIDGAQHVGEGTGEPVGFSVLQAESSDEAAALLNEHPHLHGPGNSSDVPPVLAPPRLYYNGARGAAGGCGTARL